MWGKRKCCPGRQVLQVEVPSGTSWETPVHATGPEKEGGNLGVLECNRAEGNQGTQGN